MRTKRNRANKRLHQPTATLSREEEEKFKTQPTKSLKAKRSEMSIKLSLKRRSWKNFRKEAMRTSMMTTKSKRPSNAARLNAIRPKKNFQKT